MPVTEKTYPEWVQKYRKKGTTIKRKGDSYYLYSRTSKRVPGKKYPQPVDTYIGIITPDGVVETGNKKISLSDIEVMEYGYTKALLELCPQGWKDPLGDEWQDVLAAIILKWSPESFLSRDHEAADPKAFHCSFNSQAGLLSRRIFREHRLDIKELDVLRTIYLVRMGKEEAVSRVSQEQQLLLDRIGVKLES